MNEQELKKQLMMDIATNPVAVGFFTGGFSTLILGWVLNSPLGVFTGICSLLVAGGIWSAKCLHLADSIDTAKQKVLKNKEREKEYRLNLLYHNLSRDADSRDEEAFLELKEIYTLLKNNKNQNIASIEYYTLLNTTEQIFEECISQLEKSYELKCRSVHPSTKTKVGINIKKEREAILKEVTETVKLLKLSVAKFTRENISKSQLTELRETLKQQLDTAREIDQQVSGQMLSE